VAGGKAEMKNSQTIASVIALAAVLAIYDLMKEWMNFSTIVALIVVLCLFVTWLIVQLVLNKFVLNKSEKENKVTEPKPITKMDLNRIKRILLLLKPRNVQPPKALNAGGPGKKIHKVVTRAALREDESARARVQSIVTNLCTVPGITAAAIVSTDGVIFVAAPEGTISSYRAATVTGSMFALGNRIVDEFGRDNLEQIMVRGEDGEVFFHRVAKEAFIMVLVNKGFQMGRVVREMKEAAENAAALMVA
jgi:hypothetical protein